MMKNVIEVALKVAKANGILKNLGTNETTLIAKISTDVANTSALPK